MTPTRHPFLDGLAASLPIVMGYLPIAFSFGVAATRPGFTATEAFALSLIIYAGASQFLALALLSSGAPVLVAAFTLIAMNLRHVIYGPAFMRAAGDQASTPQTMRISSAVGNVLKSEKRRTVSMPMVPREEMREKPPGRRPRRKFSDRP